VVTIFAFLDLEKNFSFSDSFPDLLGKDYKEIPLMSQGKSHPIRDQFTHIVCISSTLRVKIDLPYLFLD